MGKMWGSLGAPDSLGQLQELEIPIFLCPRKPWPGFSPGWWGLFLSALLSPVLLATPGYFPLAGQHWVSSWQPGAQSPSSAIFSVLLLWIRHEYFLWEWIRQDRLGVAAVMNPNLGSLQSQALLLVYNFVHLGTQGALLRGFAISLTLGPRLTEQPLFGILPVTSSLKEKDGKTCTDS